jgi:hypothetical protein
MKDNYEQSGKKKKKKNQMRKQLLNTKNNTSVPLFTIFSFPPRFFFTTINITYNKAI